MGLAASQARYVALTARKGDLELNGQQINQQRMTLAEETQSMFDKLLSLEVPAPGDNESDAEYQAEMARYNAEVAAVNAKTELYHTKDRMLEMDLKNVDTQHSTVQTEIDAVKKVIDKSVEGIFKTFQ